MTEHKPLVSIGLPVYNGEKYIAEAIESLLSQDYTNIEIIISDNASTDNTPQICQQYQQKDPRIQYLQNHTNIGAANNFNRTFELSKGDFFMWAAFDDLRHPTYISKCMQKLNQHPDAFICVTGSIFIDEEGKLVSGENWLIETINLSLSKRLHHYFLNLSWIGLNVYGLWRSKYLKQTRLFLEEYGPDVILGLELYLLGDVVKVEESLFFYRQFREKKHYDLIKTITSTYEKQQLMAQAPYTQLIKNLYQTLKEKNVSQEITQDFFDVLVFQQMDYVRICCLEHQSLFKDHILDPEYIYEFLKILVTTEKSPEQIIVSLENTEDKFKKLGEKRPILLLGSLQVSVILMWKYFKDKNIPIHAMIEESSLYSQPNFYENLINMSELTTRPFFIVASLQPHIHIESLIKNGYEHRKDFLYVGLNTPYLYLL
ncbi:glycosyltransferase [Bacillus salipaludis]|uniref:glycosyltransferase family 2 protein n=1 Tax=Bacillus salipaludis TaxID=2547811 RepID=UPI003D20629E